MDAATPPDKPVPPTAQPTLPVLPANDSCNAAKIASHIGKHTKSLETVLLLQPVRIIAPGTMVTMDYIESRLNIYTDDAGLIQRLGCG